MKIIGNTVGTTIPKPNWEQTDPGKGDFIKNKPVLKDGATFTPRVDTEGDLSWTNDQDRPNPKTVNIKGPAGYTPVKGTDYFTDADKKEVAEEVLAVVPKATKIQVVKSGTTVQIQKTLDNGATDTAKITLDAYDRPSIIEKDGKSAILTWEGFD